MLRTFTHMTHGTFSRVMLEIRTFSGVTLEFSGVRCHPSELLNLGLVSDRERRQLHFFYSTVTEEITTNTCFHSGIRMAGIKRETQLVPTSLLKKYRERSLKIPFLRKNNWTRSS